MGTGGNVIHHAHQGNFAHPAEHHNSFAILRRFFGIGLIQLAFGLRKHAEILRRERNRDFRLEISRDNQHRVIGLIVFGVKRFEF